MTTLLRLCLFALLASGALAGVAGPGEEIAPGVFLLQSDFGVWKNGEAEFKAGREFAIKGGDQFGWRFRVRTEKDEVKMRVVFECPAAPKRWMWNGEVLEKNESSDGRMKLSPDRRTATTESEVAVSEGWMMSPWTFDDGDPYGDHVVRIYIGEKLVRIFRFRLVEPKK